MTRCDSDGGFTLDRRHRDAQGNQPNLPEKSFMVIPPIYIIYDTHGRIPSHWDNVGPLLTKHTPAPISPLRIRRPPLTWRRGTSPRSPPRSWAPADPRDRLPILSSSSPSPEAIFNRVYDFLLRKFLSRTVFHSVR